MFPFGPAITIRPAEIFFQSALSYAFVNLKPILSGHVLVCPKRLVPRFAELTRDEVGDMFSTVQRVGGVIERAFDAQALTIVMQDGKEAGQSIMVHDSVCKLHSMCTSTSSPAGAVTLAITTMSMIM